MKLQIWTTYGTLCFVLFGLACILQLHPAYAGFLEVETGDVPVFEGDSLTYDMTKAR